MLHTQNFPCEEPVYDTIVDTLAVSTRQQTCSAEMGFNVAYECSHIDEVEENDSYIKIDGITNTEFNPAYEHADMSDFLPQVIEMKLD